MKTMSSLLLIALFTSMYATGCAIAEEPLIPQYDYSEVAGQVDGADNVKLKVGEKSYNIPLSLGYQTKLDCCEAISVIHTTDFTNASIVQTEHFETPYELTLSRQGGIASAEDILRLIDERTDEEISYEPQVVEPQISHDALMEQNYKLGQFTTSFDKSTLRKENRVFNIKKAASLIDGVVVEPDKVFSINKVIGDRNRKNGWKMAAAISGGTYVEEYGGGVCQVSSTLFNAVMMADLEIIERHHHSWPMTYVPIGRDATISTGIKDFIFKNNTEYPITILAEVNEETKELCICIYGMKNPAFAYIEIESERTGYEKSLPTEYRLDESLPNGTEVVEREGRRGRRSITYKLYYSEDGTLIDKVVAFKDTYPSISEIIYRSSDLYY